MHKKTLLYLTFTLLIFFIDINIFEAKTCYYKKGEETTTLKTNGSQIIFQEDTKLIDNTSTGSIDALTGYAITGVYKATGTAIDFSDNYVCTKYVYKIFSNVSIPTYIYWLSDVEYNYNNLTTAGISFAYSNSGPIEKWEQYNPVSGPTDSGPSTPTNPSTPSTTCTVYKHNLEYVYDNGTDFECTYSGTSGIMIYGKVGSNPSLKAADSGTALTNQLSKNVTKASECPKYIYIKPASTTRVMFNVYDDPNNNSVKSCSIDSSESKDSVVTDKISQICTFINILDSNKKLIVKVSATKVYLDTGTGSKLVYGDGATSNTGVFFEDQYTEGICDNKYAFYFSSGGNRDYITCPVNTPYYKLISFSKENEWLACLNGYTVKLNDNRDKPNMYENNKSWNNPDYVSPYQDSSYSGNGHGNTGDLEIMRDRDNTSNKNVCDVYFGAPGSRNSLYSIIHTIILAIRIAAPILLILMTSIDLAKATAIGEDAIQKSKKHGITRIIVAIVIMLLPSLINILFDLAALPSCSIF